MELNKIFRDEEAVSPVIGVILMVAITVILAAVIGTFVLGLGDQVQSTSPQATFSVDLTDNGAGTADQLAITHDGGDAIPSDRVSFTTTGVYADDADGSSTDTVAGSIASGSSSWSDFSSNDVTAGSSVTLDGDDFVESGTTNLLDGTADLDSDGTGDGNDALVLNGATARIVWTSDAGDSSATLGTWNGPDA